MTSQHHISLLAFLLLAFLPALVYPQTENKQIRQGNRLYEDQNFKEAEIQYRKSLDRNASSVPGRYNLGNSLYKQKNYPEAILSFDSVLKTDPSDRVLSQAYYNLGNSLLKYALDSAGAQPNALTESIEAYKQSLRLNPMDSAAKYNLAYAQRLLRQEEQQQQQQGPDNQQQDQQQQQEQQDQQQQQEQQQEQTRQEQQEQQQQQAESREISKQDAERMLEALKNDEKNTLEKLKRQQMKSQRVTIEKDW